MRSEISYRKRRKGLLAIMLSAVFMLGILYRPMPVSAVSSNVVTVEDEGAAILVGEGDIIGFGNGVYGNIQIAGNSDQKYL